VAPSADNSVDTSLAEGVGSGDRRALARALSVIDDDPYGSLAASFGSRSGRAHVVGITGAAGTGKSTLVSSLIGVLRSKGRTVAVLAIDPSSPLTGGAVLGDRVRMSDHSGDDGVFIRSMAHRGASGGLSEATGAAVSALDAAGFDVVIVETLGAGQSEVGIAAEADTTVLVVVPGMGDAVQMLKAGVLEVAHIFAVNKADTPGADHVAAQLRALAVDTAPADTSAWRPRVALTVATTGEGVGDLADAIEAHEVHLRERPGGRRPAVARRPCAVSENAERGLYGRLVLVSGTANTKLADEIAAHVGEGLLPRDVFQFANGNTFVQLGRSVRGADVFWIQPTSPPTNDNLMELLIAIDTLRRDSAARITAVVPYYGYGRSDKKDQPRVPITARLVADMITVAGADRLLTMDLHAGQIQGFFRIPVDDITARHLLADYARKTVSDAATVVAPDLGRAKVARNFAEEVDLPLAIIEKRRSPDGKSTKSLNLIGDVDGRDVLIIDDEIDTAGTMVDAAKFVRSHGARRIRALATHAILSPPATDRLRDAPIDEIVVTNSVAIPDRVRPRNTTKLNVGPLLGGVIHRIHLGRSVGEMLNE
jgi:ribose-phosphate pyrophosphokinase